MSEPEAKPEMVHCETVTCSHCSAVIGRDADGYCWAVLEHDGLRRAGRSGRAPSHALARRLAIAACDEVAADRS